MNEKAYILMFSLLFGCSVNNSSVESDPPSFDKVSLENIVVSELQLHDQYLYAGTDIGLLRKGISTMNDSLWEKLNLDKAIVDFVNLTDQEILAAVKRPDMNSEKPGLYKTTDTGENWKVYQNGFGGNEEDVKKAGYWITALDRHPEEPLILYATSGGSVVRSINGGQSWFLFPFEYWDSRSRARFVYVNKNDPSQIWTGGRDAIFRPYLGRSLDGGESWNNGSIYEEYADHEGSYEDILIHQDDSDRMIAGAGRSVQRTDDWGDNWVQEIHDNAVYTLAQGSLSSETVYASGVNQDRSLFIMESRDFGETWVTINLDEEVNDVYTNDLLSVTVNGQEMVFLGTTKGIFRYIPSAD